MRRTAVLVALLTVAAVGVAGAQEPPTDDTATPSAPAPPPLPAPQDSLTTGTPAAGELVDYFRALAAASPRVFTESLGSTEEGRDLQLVVVGEAGRLADLERLAAISKALVSRDPGAEEVTALLAGGVPLVHVVGGLAEESAAGSAAPADLLSPRLLAEVAYSLAATEAPPADVIWLLSPVADPDAYDRLRDWRRLHGRQGLPVPWPGYYAPLGTLDGDPTLALPVGRALAEVERRFAPQRTLVAPPDIEGLRSMLEGVVRSGSELLAGARQRAERSIFRGRADPPYGWVFPPDRTDPQPRADLARVLLSHGVEVHRLTAEWVEGLAAPVASPPAEDTTPADPTPVQAAPLRAFPADSLVIRADQPAGDVARAILEGTGAPRQGRFSPLWPAAGGLPLPVLFGARGVALTEPDVLALPVAGRDWPPPEPEDTRRRRRREPPPPPPVLLEPVIEPPTVAGRVDGFGQEVFLLAAGLQARHATTRVAVGSRQVDAAESAFRSGGRWYPAGTLFVYAERSEAEDLAEELGVVFDAPTSLPDVRRHVVDLPRLGVLHTWRDTEAAGWLRRALDRARVDYTLIAPEELPAGRLGSRFDVVLVPEADGDLLTWLHGASSSADGPVPFRGDADHPALGTPKASADVTRGMGFLGLGELERFARDGGVLVILGNAGTPWIEGGLLPFLRAAPMDPADEGLVGASLAWPEHPVGYGLGAADGEPEGAATAVLATAPRWQLAESATDEPVVLRFGAGHGAVTERRSRSGALDDSGGDLIEEDLDIEAVDLSGDEPVEDLDATADTEILPEVTVITAEDLPSLPSLPDPPPGVSGAPAVVDVPLGDGRVILFAFDPFVRDLDRRGTARVWNVLLHWNDLP